MEVQQGDEGGLADRPALPFPWKARGATRAETQARSKAHCMASSLFSHWARVEVGYQGAHLQHLSGPA